MITNAAALSISLGGGVLAAVYLLKPIRWVRVNGFWSSLYWTFRSWLWNYPITQDYAVWDTGDPNDVEVFERDRRRLLRMWRFLGPFFVSCGYHPYVPKDSADIYSDLVPTTGKSTVTHSFPFASCLYKTDADAKFMYYSPFVWAARDRIGRDVVIKAVSGSTPTKELRALRLLHSDDLRDDPRNHTIPVLDYLEWNVAIWADFATVGEVVRYGQAFFEAIAFLHEHYIAHGDTIGQNFVMDVMVPKPKEFGVLYAGVRGPERKYAFIDFETATLPVLASDSSSFNKQHHSPHSPAPEFAIASKHEVARLATNLEVHLRVSSIDDYKLQAQTLLSECIEDVVPDLGTLLELMKDCDSPDQPTAAAAFSRYQEICSLLSADDMHLEVKAIWWDKDRIKYRVSPPLYISDC
ncbi:hypothetical protein CPB85DRAFT_1440913 [Mucidula mucida]|nr:hypothetical protein CPB85DRAFT_1440913 [Mucidula mucida]